MRSWLFRFVLCWLAIALPVQGWAAAALRGCGGAMPAVQAQASEPAHHAGHSMAAPADAIQPGHEGHHLATDADKGSQEVPSMNSADASHNAHDGTHASKGKCSACAACCLGAAMPATLLSFASPITRDTLSPPAPARIAAFLTGGLERPPRSPLAA